jgi:deferrochelatase/peroxidase EfeB
MNETSNHNEEYQEDDGGNDLPSHSHLQSSSAYG